MVSDKDVEHIAQLADIGISKDDLREFTVQFNAILNYFDILDGVTGEEQGEESLCNVLREDDAAPSLSQEDVLENAGSTEDGFIKAPRVM